MSTPRGAFTTVDQLANFIRTNGWRKNIPLFVVGSYYWSGKTYAKKIHVEIIPNTAKIRKSKYSDSLALYPGLKEEDEHCFFSMRDNHIGHPDQSYNDHYIFEKIEDAFAYANGDEKNRLEKEMKILRDETKRLNDLVYSNTIDRQVDRALASEIIDERSAALRGANESLHEQRQENELLRKEVAQLNDKLSHTVSVDLRKQLDETIDRQARMISEYQEEIRELNTKNLNQKELIESYMCGPAQQKIAELEDIIRKKDAQIHNLSNGITNLLNKITSSATIFNN